MGSGPGGAGCGSRGGMLTAVSSSVATIVTPSYSTQVSVQFGDLQWQP